MSARRAIAILTIALASAALAEEAPLPTDPFPLASSGPVRAANQWVRLDKADVKRIDAPLVYDPELERFMVLGGSVNWAEYPKPHPFDELIAGRCDYFPTAAFAGPRCSTMISPSVPPWMPSTELSSITADASWLSIRKATRGPGCRLTGYQKYAWLRRSKVATADWATW